MSNQSLEKYSAEEWDHIRKRFHNSILNETEIAKLGQNVGVSWPFKGAGETPAKYMEMTLEELGETPGLIGKKSRIRNLMDILRETLAFDDPFSDMAEKVEADSEEDDTFEKILTKLEIEHNYPAGLVHFNADTVELLGGANVETLIDVIRFGQELPKDSEKGDELKRFLNSLAHKGEKDIMMHLPYRRGVRGLHLPEAIGLIGKDLSKEARLYLSSKSGAVMSEDETAALANIDEASAEAEVQRAVDQVAQACEWFEKEAAEMQEIHESGMGLERFFIIVNDSEKEPLALGLAKLHIGDDGGKKSGLLGKLFGR